MAGTSAPTPSHARSADTGAMDEQEYRERLVHDAAIWRREGLISEQQEQALLARSGARAVETIRALRLGWFATGVSIVGAIVLAAGVVLLFAANWNQMPSWFPGRRHLRRCDGRLRPRLRADLSLQHAARRQRADPPRRAAVPGGTVPHRADLQHAGRQPGAVVPPRRGRRVSARLPVRVTHHHAARPRRLHPGRGRRADFALSDSPKTQSVLIVIAALGIAFFAIGRLHTLRRDLEHFAEAYVFSGLLRAARPRLHLHVR